jgi:hypothetical protein
MELFWSPCTFPASHQPVRRSLAERQYIHFSKSKIEGMEPGEDAVSNPAKKIVERITRAQQIK